VVAEADSICRIISVTGGRPENRGLSPFFLKGEKAVKNMPLLAVIALLLTACGGAESEAKKAVLGSLKDPDSAKFGKFTQVNEKSACLTVNARNSMGGYTGDQQAWLIKQENAWVVLDIDKLSHEMCIDTMKKVSEK